MIPRNKTKRSSTFRPRGNGDPTDRQSPVLDRRTAMMQIPVLAVAATTLGTLAAAAQPQPASGMGLVIYNLNLRRKWLRQQNPQQDLFQPLAFLKHCRSLGAGGMQANLGVMEAAAIGQLRAFAERHGMFIDAIIRPPKDKADSESIRIGDQNRSGCPGSGGSHDDHPRAAIRAIRQAG